MYYYILGLIKLNERFSKNYQQLRKEKKKERNTDQHQCQMNHD